MDIFTVGKADARWTYKNNRGYMPMVDYIAETGQIIACGFRAGNTPPAKENLNFIRQYIIFVIGRHISKLSPYIS